MKMIVSWNLLLRFIDRLLRLLTRQLAIVVRRSASFGCCLMVIGLSGCVKYDTGINFSSLNYGEIVEHIQLGEQLNSFSQNPVQAWLASIEQRTKQAQGQIERIGDRELNVIIPFNNAQDLVTKINRYFNPDPQLTESESKFNSHLQIDQNNFLVAVRNHFIYDIDLRSLTVKSSDPKVSIDSSNFVDLDFSLQSPWGVKNRTGINNFTSSKTSGNKITWKLQPGQLNHIDATFWLPNSLGVGAILIILVSLSGYYFKYRQLPWAKLD